MQHCSEHSGQCQKTSYIEKQVDDLKKELHEQKGYVNGKFDSINQDVKNVNQKLRDEMKEIKREIQAEIKFQLDDFKLNVNDSLKEIKGLINTKESNKVNRFGIYLANGILPTAVLIIGIIIQYYMK